MVPKAGLELQRLIQRTYAACGYVCSGEFVPRVYHADEALEYGAESAAVWVYTLPTLNHERQSVSQQNDSRRGRCVFVNNF